MEDRYKKIEDNMKTGKNIYYDMTRTMSYILLAFVSITLCQCQNSRQARQPNAEEEQYIPAYTATVSENKTENDEKTSTNENTEDKKEESSTANEKKEYSTDYAETIVQEAPSYISDETNDSDSEEGEALEQEQTISNTIQQAANTPSSVQNQGTSSNQSAGNNNEPYRPIFATVDTRGFERSETEHFILYEEGNISDDFVNAAERMRVSVLANLAFYNPEAREQKLSIYLAHSKDNSQAFSKRHSIDTIYDILDTRRIFLVRNSSFNGMLAHNLAHSYFGTFFPPKNSTPYWLMEGMAINTQIETAGKRSLPVWFDNTMAKIEKGARYSIEVVTSIDDIEGTAENDIRIWIAQAYSLTKFLIDLKGKKTFYNFCVNIRNGLSTEQAIYATYFKDLKTIEREWKKKLASQAADRKNRSKK